MSSENMFEEFSSYGLSQLKDYLNVRGLQSNGNKSQLVSRFFVAWENGVQPKFSQQELHNKIKEEYNNRLLNAGLIDPKSLHSSCWTDDVTKWPKIDLGKIFTFVLSTKDHDVEYIGHYKTHKSYSYFMSGFVDTVYTTTLKNFHIIKSLVTPSQAVRNEPHDVWIALDISTNKIVTSWCSCIAGMAQTCNHVIAVLYKIEYANTMGYIDPACTSTPCGWNERTKRVDPSRVRDLNVRRDDRRKFSGVVCHSGRLNMDSRCVFDPRRESQRQVDSKDISFLFHSIASVKPSAVLFKGLPSSNSNAISMPKSLCDLIKSTDNRRDLNCLLFTTEQVQCIEENTRGQRTNEAWTEQRIGRLTSSNHHEISCKIDSIVKGKKAGITVTVAKILGRSKSLSHLPAIKYGLENEKNALSYLFAVNSQMHKNFKLQECGLFVKADHPYIAASPDAIAFCDCCGKLSVEVKCPFVLAESSVCDGWNKTDFLNMSNNTLHLKRSHKYYTQIQSQMAVVDVKRSYFVVWSPHGSFIEVIDFDMKAFLVLQDKLRTFFKVYVMPYLLGTKELYCCPVCNLVCLSDDEISCDQENGILCDICDLWFHWKCANVASTPNEDTWICHFCHAIDM